MIKLELTKKSFGDKTILENINLAVDKNDKLHLIGQSGVGKTTLLRILMGVDKDFNGSLVNDFSSASATYPERVFMGGISIFKEIKIFSGASDDAIDNALKALNIYGAKNKKASELSTGMRSRASIIRSVLTPVEITYLDEPLLGLDEETKLLTIDFIKEHTKDRVVIYTGENIFDEEAECHL